MTAQLKDFALYNIDWNMTPGHAVAMYLEWGNNAHAQRIDGRFS